MARITFMTDRVINGKKSYHVTKDGPCVATIYYVDKAALNESGVGLNRPHWVLKHLSGRVDRHPSLAEAKLDAAKI